MRKLLLFAILLFNCSSGYAQLSMNDSAFRLQVNRYMSYYRTGQEMMYVQFNKQVYFPGEHIWFKAYVLNRASGEPSLTTRNLYVELFDGADRLVQRKTLLVESGSAWDDFYLNDSLTPGQYNVRAYTSWSRNFGPENYFVQALQIGEKKQGSKRDANGYDIRFFPEGGSIIAGLPTTVGFKITDQNGYGISLQGVVMQNDKAIRFVRSNDLGLGAFSIIERAGQETTVQFTLPDGSMQKALLPSALSQGIQLSVDQHLDDSLIIDVATNEEGLKELALKKFHLLVHRQGEVGLIERPVFTRSKILEYRVPKNILPRGVVHVTLFDDHYVPIADRAVFVPARKSMSIEVTSRREKDSVVISVSTKNAEGKSIPADLSMSFLPARTVSEIERNMVSASLLEDVEGFVEHPAYYYFNEREKELDFLLLTQSGKLYNWNAIFNIPLVFNFPFEQGFTIRGYAPDWNSISKKPALFAISPDNGIQQAVSLDEKGKFELKNLMVYDSTPIYFNTVNESSKKYFKDLSIEEMPLHFDSVFHTTRALTRPGDSSVTLPRLVNRPRENVMKEVRVTSKSRKNNSSANDPFVNSSDRVVEIDAKNVKRYRDLVDLLRREYNLNISYDNFNHLVIDMRTGPSSFLYPPQPVLVVDGMISNLDDLQFFSVAQIQSVAVNKIGNSKLGSRGAGGSIILKTRATLDHLFDETTASSVINKIWLWGFSRPAAFFAPTYSVNAHDPNFIKYGAIYWKPDVFTDENGVVQFKFFWPEGAPAIELRAEGIGQDGSLLFFAGPLKQ